MIPWEFSKSILLALTLKMRGYMRNYRRARDTDGPNLVASPSFPSVDLSRNLVYSHLSRQPDLAHPNDVHYPSMHLPS